MSRMSAWLRLHGTVRRGTRSWRWHLRTEAPIVLVSGPSGSGKSTLLRLLAGLHRLAEGELHVLGSCWDAPRSRRFVQPWRRRAGWLPQQPSLFPHLSAERNLRFAQRLPEAEVERVASWLDAATLLRRPAPQLSGGERQRIALGRTLLAAPRLLLLDEPFSAQDPARARRLAERLVAHVTRHDLHVVLVAHEPAAAGWLHAESWTMGEDGTLHPPGRATPTRPHVRPDGGHRPCGR